MLAAAALLAGCGSATHGTPRPGTHRAAALSPLTLGFSGDQVLTDPAVDSLWISRAVAEGAGIVRVDIKWSDVAPSAPPPGFDAANPASPDYDWAPVDAAVRDLHAHGLAVLLNIYSAPSWAEGPHMPSSEPPGTWRPNAADYAAFATAVARRYDGHFPDPLQPGVNLPRVRDWQAWNEPNLDEYLSPQWTRSGRHWVDTSPVIYRRLLNAFYAAVKRVSPSNFVISAGTSPYGDWPGFRGPGKERMPPVRFYRDLFCLGKGRQGSGALRPLPCPDPPHLDAIDHHVYGVYGPLWYAGNPDDVATPDTFKLTRVLDAARRFHHVLPSGPKAQWVTEISWSSKPPNPQGVPLLKHAHWYEQAMYVLWRQGVDTILFFMIRDAVPSVTGPGPKGGLYFLDGQPKPAATAYRFPFVTERLTGASVEAWGRSPQAGVLRIQRLRAGHWTTLKTLHVLTHAVFDTSVALRGAGVLRAQVDGQTSLAWSQGR